MRMSTNGNGQSKQPSTAQHETAPLLSEKERVVQYSLAQSAMNHDWATNPRWKGIERPYTSEDVLRLRGSIVIEHTLARMERNVCGNFCRASRTSMHWEP